jgi:hypothetical protein
MLFTAMAMILVPSLSAILMLLLIFGTVLWHNILCLRLQKSLLRPTIPLPANFPTLLVVLSVLSFIYSALVFQNIISMMRVPDAQYIKMANEAAYGNSQVPSEMILAGRKFASTLGLIHGLAIAVNCVLSSVFMNRWKKLYAVNDQLDSFPEE